MRIFLLFLISLTGITPIVALSSSGFLRDEADLYVHDPELKKDLSERLDRFHNTFHVPFYVITQTSTSYNLDINAQAAARRLELLGESKEGFILLYESDSGVFAISSRPGIVETDVEKWATTSIPQYMDNAIHGAWEANIKKCASADLFDNSTKEFNPQLACIKIAQAWIDAASMLLQSNNKYRTSPYLIGMFAALFLVAFLAFMALKKTTASREVRNKTSFAFPAPEVKIRLGAMYSGGKMVTRGFAPEPRRE